MSHLLHAAALRAVRFPVPTLTALLACGVAPAAAMADGQVVNRADGLTGERFSSTALYDVSDDGRYVLLAGPETLVGGTDDYTYLPFLRDRTAGTLKLVVRESGPAGAQFDGTPVDLSAGGTKVLIARTVEGTTERRLVVRDTAADTTTVVGALPGGAAANAPYGQFVDGDAAILYTAVAADGTPSIYRRALPNGTPTLLKAGAALTSTTRDGSTFTWRRALKPVTSPAGLFSTPQTAEGEGFGYTTIGGASRLVVQPDLAIRANQAPYPYCSAVVQEGKTPQGLQIDPSGRRLWWSYIQRDGGFPSHTPLTIVERSTQSADAPVGNVAGGGWAGGPDWPSVRAVSARGDFALVRQPTRSGPYAGFGALTAQGGTPQSYSRGATPAPLATDDGRAFAQDKGYVARETAKGTGGEYYGDTDTLAFDPEGPVPAPLPVVAPVAHVGEIADTPDAAVPVKFTGCEKPTATQVIDTALAKPVTTSRSAGTVTLKGGGAPISWTVKVQTFGSTTWSRTIDLRTQAATRTVTLPKPWWLLPQTVITTVNYEQSTPIPASSVSARASWTALR